MNRSEQIDKALKDILKDIECARANKQCNIDYFLSSIEKCAKVAVALPRRNCDVGTAEEQMKRQHDTMCNTTKACPDSDWSCRKCFAEWGQMPYTEGEENGK